MSEEVAESIVVATPIEVAYRAVSDVRRVTRWSPECVGVWVWLRRAGRTRRFVGFNRRKASVWFTTCRVVRDDPRVEFAYEVTTFGLAVSRWGYRVEEVEPAIIGGVSTARTRITEYWVDRRGGLVRGLGRVITGPVAYQREQANRDGMRTTLERLKTELENQPAAL